MAIEITKSNTADTRTCDWSKVSKEELLEASKTHIKDIQKGFDFFIDIMNRQKYTHDLTKINDIDGFHNDFKTGFKETSWWESHQKKERHHFNNEKYIPEDVNLIDILDQIIDGVMAGMARSGEYRKENISKELLERAYKNTVELLLNETVVVK